MIPPIFMSFGSAQTISKPGSLHAKHSDIETEVVASRQSRCETRAVAYRS